MCADLWNQLSILLECQRSMWSLSMCVFFDAQVPAGVSLGRSQSMQVGCGLTVILVGSEECLGTADWVTWCDWTASGVNGQHCVLFASCCCA